MPVVVRIPYGGGIGAVEHHSESPEAYFAHTPGLRVVAPGDPESAFEMIQQAIACPDPVIFLEPKRRYWDKADFDESIVHTATGNLFDARILRRGTDLTLATYGSTVRTCLQVADTAAAEGRSIEVVDLRSISPLDLATLAESAGRTGRLVVVHEAQVSFGAGAEIAARITEQCFYQLSAPVLRVGGYDVPYPPSRLEHHYLPDLDRVLDAVDTSMSF